MARKKAPIAHAGVAARNAALDLLGMVVRKHQSLDDSFDVAADGIEGRDRGFVRLLVATTLRRLGQVDALLAHCLSEPLPPNRAAVHDILRLGAAQLMFLDTPAHAAVDTSVDLSKARKLEAYAKLINAVLRRIDREGRDLVAAQDEARLNTPDWLWQSWTAAYGETTARGIALAHLHEAPLDVTVKTEAAGWAEKLDATLLPTGSLRRAAGGAVAELPGYAEGAWWVQDAAAALPARLLGDMKGQHIADLCAAPGGKTAQLAAGGAQVIALDRSARRLERLTENLARLGLTAEVVVGDAATWRPDAPLDAVLLDAPCSATGTIRRHPDALWLKKPADVAKLAETQKKLLAAAADMLKPGGTLVYCVCSMQPEEGAAVVDAVIAAGAPLKRVPVQVAEVGSLAELITPQGDLRTLPVHLADQGGMDAFFAARLQRI